MLCRSIILLIIASFYSVDGAKILGIFPLPSKSHFMLTNKLLTSLAERGHEVVVITPYPLKYEVKNYREVFLEEMHKLKEDKLRGVLKHNSTLFEKLGTGVSMFKIIIEAILNNEEVQKLKQEHFDLVIMFPVGTESLLGLAHHYGAPVILFNTLGAINYLSKFNGNPSPPSYIPNMILPFPDEMNFWQRLGNALLSFFGSTVFEHFSLGQQQELLHKFFPEAPPLQELITNVSLTFVNAHISTESPRPYVPNIIPVGGIHIEDPKELPTELKAYLDGATNGAIFFSLGSNVQISSLPSGTVTAIMKVLGDLKLRVLFKSDSVLPDVPENVKVQTWLPQNDILAHPNVRLFISHGGLLSTIEAVYHGVPILGIPIFGDQHNNIAEAVYKGYALQVNVNDITEESFSKAVKELLTNTKYSDNISLRSSLMRDQPIKPLDSAIFWVEHVLKYRGAAHLRNSGVKLSFYQYFLLDVIAFLVISLYILYRVTKLFLKFVYRKTVDKLFRKRKED